MKSESMKERFCELEVICKGLPLRESELGRFVANAIAIEHCQQTAHAGLDSIEESKAKQERIMQEMMQRRTWKDD